MFRKIALLFVLNLCSYAAWAGCPVGATVASIKASDQPYASLPAVQGVNINSEFEIRNAALSAIAGAYRVSKGLGSLPTGAQFQVTYADGSSECALVNNPYSSLGAVPEPGTQKAASSNGGGAAGGGNTGFTGGGGGGGGGGTYTFRCYLVDPDTGAREEVPCNNDP